MFAVEEYSVDSLFVESGSPIRKDSSSDDLFSSADDFELVTSNWVSIEEQSFDDETSTVANDQIFIHNSPNESPVKKENHFEDVLVVFEGLLQAGLITQEEYDERKSELENIDESGSHTVDLFALEIGADEEDYTIRLRKRKQTETPKDKKKIKIAKMKQEKTKDGETKEAKRAKLMAVPKQIQDRLERDLPQKDALIEQNRQLHTKFEEKRVFWKAFHHFRQNAPIGTFPYIASRPVDLHKLYTEVTKRGGYTRISTKHGEPVQWSKKWEHIFSAVVKHKGPYFDPKSSEVLPLGDVRHRRQKLKKYYEDFLLEFEKANAFEAEVTSKTLGHYIRCACGHTHCEVPKGACVTCDHYLETRWNICVTDLVQCEACGAWQHIQCLLEEFLISPVEVQLLETCEDFHYYCEMCRKKEFSHPWTSKVLSRELPVGWSTERRFRIGKRPDYYSFKPGNQLHGRFCKPTVLRSFVQLDEAIGKAGKEGGEI